MTTTTTDHPGDVPAMPEVTFTLTMDDLRRIQGEAWDEGAAEATDSIARAIEGSASTLEPGLYRGGMFSASRIAKSWHPDRDEGEL